MLSATQLVADINQQAPPIGYDHGIALDGVLYFSGRSVESGITQQNELWKYDPQGNDGAGELTKIAGNEVGLSNPISFLIVEGKIYFGGQENLWQYDPNASGGEGALTKLADVWIDPFSTGVAFDGSLYFRANEDTGNFTLLRYNIAEQTISDFSTGVDSIGDSAKLVVADGKIYFYTLSEESKLQLWQYDPNAADSVALSIVLQDLNHNHASPEIAAVGGKVYFPADDGIHGTELWSYDPAGNDGAGNAAMVADVHLGAEGSEPQDFAVLDGKLYLKMFDHWSRFALWVVDPELEDWNGGLGVLNDKRLGETARELESSGDSLYFTARPDGLNWELWRYRPGQGADSFQRVSGAVPAANSDRDLTVPQQAIELGDVLALKIDDTLWQTTPVFSGGDGSVVPIEDTSVTTQSANPHSLFALGDVIYFVASDGIHGSELWKYDPNASFESSGPQLVADLFSGIDSSNPTNLTIDGDKIIFRATTAEGLKLFQLDTTTGAVTTLADLLDSPLDSISEQWVIQDRKLYFSRVVGVNVELVFYDLTAEPGTGSIEVAVDLPFTVFRNPDYLVSAGGKIYFDGFDSDKGPGLFRFDPLASGEGSVVRIDAYDGEGFSPYGIVALGDRIYFRGYDAEHGLEVWEYDPQANDGLGAARRISDTPPYSILGPNIGPSPSQLTVLGNKLYFQIAMRGPDTSYQIWEYDPLANQGAGNLSQVVSLEGYHQGLFGLIPIDHPLPSHEGFLYFSVNSPAGDREIWRYNTGATGQPDLARVVNVENASYLGEVLTLDGKLYYTALVTSLGNELYVTDDLSSSTWVQFDFTSGDPATVGTLRGESAPVEAVLDEWEDATGQIWLTVGEEALAGAFNLSVEIEVDNPAFADLIVQSHLGASVATSLETVDGVRYYQLSFTGLDLSGYQAGDQVLLANVLLSLAAETTSWISLDPQASFAQPTAQHGVSLTSVVNRSTDEPLLYDHHIRGKFQAMAYDTNDDGGVGLVDFTRFAANFGKTVGPANPGAYRFDFNHDGIVGLADFALFAKHFGLQRVSPPLTSANSLALEGEPTPSTPSAATSDIVFQNSDWLFDEQDSATSTPPTSAADTSVDQPEAIVFDVELASQPAWDPRVVDALLKSRDLAERGEAWDEDESATVVDE